MSRLSDAELANSLHLRRSAARCVSRLQYPDARPNFCHENAEAYARQHQGCTLVGGWLIEDCSGWNYFIAHTVVQHPDRSLVDPTPLPRQYPFIPHDGSDEDFALQRHNRPRVQYPPLDVLNCLHEPPVAEPEQF